MGDEIDMIIAWLLGVGSEPSAEDLKTALEKIVRLRDLDREQAKTDTAVLKDPAADWVRVVSSSEHVVEIFDGAGWLVIGATDQYEKAEAIAEGLRQCVRGACAAAGGA